MMKGSCKDIGVISGNLGRLKEKTRFVAGLMLEDSEVLERFGEGEVDGV
jgi:hypothetical protein